MCRMIGFALVVMLLVGAAGIAATTEIEPNEIPSQANAVGTLDESLATFTIMGAMDYPGDIDWFALSVLTASTSTILSVDADSDIQIVLYDEQLAFIASKSQEMPIALDEGNYLVRLQSADLVTVDYVFSVSTAIERESNDGLVEATLLGPITEDSSLIAYGGIDPAGDIDMFGFMVPDGFSQSCRIETSGLQGGDTVIVLYAFDDTLQRYVPILHDDDSGSAAWSRLYLAPQQTGSFVVRVEELFHNDRIESYQLRVAAFSGDPEPNDSIDTATPLGTATLDSALNATGFLSADDRDYYAFSVADFGEDSSPAYPEITVATSGYPQADNGGDSIICIYTEAGEELFRDDDGGSNLWSSITEELQPGNYFVEVTGIDTDSVFEYEVSISVKLPPACVNEQEPNNNFASAQKPAEAGAISRQGLRILGEISPAEDIDIFQFTLDESAQVTIETSGSSTGDSFICLYDNAEYIISSDDDGGEGYWSKVEQFLAAGTYYVTVENYYGYEVFDYQLDILISP